MKVTLAEFIGIEHMDEDELRDFAHDLLAENEKLRELAVLQSVIFKHMSTCLTTDCQVCPVKEECAESVYLEGVLGIDDKETSWLVQWHNEDMVDVKAENAKLRELASILCFCMQIHKQCDDCKLNGAKGEIAHDPLLACEGLHAMLRELGIEVP